MGSRLARKVIVAGAPGAGKTSFARAFANLTGAAYTELDALYHGPNWTKRPTFEADLDAFTSQADWITEWQYEEAQPLLAARADTLIWLDFPLPVVLARVTRRTVGRWVRKEELWAGNREQPLWRIFTDPSNMIRWSFASRHAVRDALPEVLAKNPHLAVRRLSSPRQARRFLRAAR